MTKLQKSFDTKTVGEKVKELRKSRSMTQDELGEKVLGGISRPQISNLERGSRNFSIHQLYSIANYFGVTLEYLGLKTEVVETNDLLERAKLIFENENVPLEEKQELYEEVMKLYLSAKEQIKK